jgi:transcriptional regulator of acetoin/glycerol metabolism
VAEGPQVMVDDLSPVVKTSDRQPSSSTFTIPPHHTLAEIEKLAILQTLERTSWNKRKAASILGVYRPTLYSKLRKYHLSDGPNGSGRGGTQKTKAAPAPPIVPPADEPPPPR